MLEELAFLPRYELRPDSFFALYVVRIVTLLPPSPIQESEFFLLSLIFENPSSTIFCQFFLLLPSFISPFILSFSLLFPLTKTKENSCCHWLRPRMEAEKKTMTSSTMTRKCDCAESWVCGRNEKNKGAKRMNKGIQWVERQNARLVRLSGYPETHGRRRTERKDRKNTQK